MPPSVASSVSRVRTRTKFPSGSIGPRIRLPSRVHSFLSVVARCSDVDVAERKDVEEVIVVIVDVVLPEIVARSRWQLLPLVKASERPMRPVIETTTNNSCVKYLIGSILGYRGGRWVLAEER